MKAKLLSQSLLFGSFLSLSQAGAAVIYQDDFSGASGDGLNGTAPDVRTGSQTWSASSLYTFSGGSSVNATTTTPGTVRGAYLPFTPQSGFLYDLSAAVAFASTGTVTNSLQLGFISVAPSASTNTTAVASASGGPAIFLRQTGTYEARATGGTALSGFSGSIPASTVTAPHVLRLTLDTSGTQWVMRSYLDGVEVGTGHTYTTAPTILGVGFAANTGNVGAPAVAVGAEGAFSNFTLTGTAIPEPSAALLGMVGTISMLAFRGRRS